MLAAVLNLPPGSQPHPLLGTLAIAIIQENSEEPILLLHYIFPCIL